MKFVVVAILFASVASSYGMDKDMGHTAVHHCDTDGVPGLSWCEVQACKDDGPSGAADIASLAHFNSVAGCNGENADGSCNANCVISKDNLMAAVKKMRK